MSEFATAQETDRYRKGLPQAHADHFRRMGDLFVSSIGLGTYLGNSNDATDHLYLQAIKRSIELGCNVLDTAINYRCQRSERTIGQALSELEAGGKVRRGELVIATKGGFLSYDGAPPQDPLAYAQDKFIATGVMAAADIVASCHCIAPGYIQHELDQSLKNLKLTCLDIYYLHNPEIQLEDISRKDFNRRLRSAFEVLEKNVEAGKIRMYGLATWSGFLRSPQESESLSLEGIVNLAKETGGEGHHFKVIQLPYNLGMADAHLKRNQRIGGLELTILEAAVHLGIYVMASAPLGQRHLISGLSPKIGRALAGLDTDAQRAIQFTRSTPGVGTALAGMKQLSHVEENLRLVSTPAAGQDQIVKVLREIK